MTLSDKSCIPCRGGVPALSESEAKDLLKQIPGWELNDEATRIRRRFKFKNFQQALDFVNKLGAQAEAENHHPDIKLGWGYAEVDYYTHKIGGLHENDFVMAAKANGLA